jgi:hypothetical protein
MIPPSAPDLAPEPAGVCSRPRRRPASGEAPARTPNAHRPDLIARLKAGIAALEGAGPRFDPALPAGGPSPWRLGLDALDVEFVRVFIHSQIQSQQGFTFLFNTG